MKKQAQEILTKFESNVKNLTRDFQDEKALNFYHEHELTAYLMIWTRHDIKPEGSEDSPTHLVHLEWPCTSAKSIDLVLWRPSSCSLARCNWKIPRCNSAKEIPLLAAVQIKRGPGRLISWSLTSKDLKDLETVYNSPKLGKPMLYFLEWVDHDLQENDDKYSIIKVELMKWCNKDIDSRRALVMSRNAVGFAFPEGQWLVNPLPFSPIN